MVSEKVVVALLVIAILLSVLSVFLTVSIDLSGIRGINVPEGKPKTSDFGTGHVSLVVTSPPET